MSVPTREEYEKATDEIHLEIGRAITEWSYVEQWLFDIFARLASPGGAISVGLSTSFNQVYSFDTRIAMVSRLVETSGFSEERRKKQLDDWKPLAKKLKKLNQKRNQIAHGSIISPKIVMSGPPQVLPVWVPFYDAHAYKMYKLAKGLINAPEFREFSATDISEIRKSFFDVQRPLSDFFRAHFGNPGP